MNQALPVALDDRAACTANLKDYRHIWPKMLAAQRADHGEAPGFVARLVTQQLHILYGAQCHVVRLMPVAKSWKQIYSSYDALSN
jgi:hypothetical protein